MSSSAELSDGRGNVSQLTVGLMGMSETRCTESSSVNTDSEPGLGGGVQLVSGLPEMHSLIGMYGPVMTVDGVIGGEISPRRRVVACDILSPSPANQQNKSISL